MCRLTTDGRHLANLVREAIALCHAAQKQLPARSGPGRPQQYEQWQLAVLIFVAVAHRRKSKSAQYRFLQQHAADLLPLVGLAQLPCRATYFKRYACSGPLFQKAVKLQGRAALAQHLSNARVVAVDKSLIAAQGPPWPRRQQLQGKRPPGLDEQARWGYSPHDGWVWGYSYEVVVCATENRLVFPLLASADTGSCNEHKSLAAKLPLLPRSVRYVVVDGGYDGNALGETLEYDQEGRRTGRRFVCPLQSRGAKPAVGRTVHRGRRERSRQRRWQRQQFYQSPKGQRIYMLRSRSVEPFHQWFKHLFDLHLQVWHRGLDNNRAMLLAAIFCYQLLVRYAFRCGRRDAQIQWLLDGL